MHFSFKKKKGRRAHYVSFRQGFKLNIRSPYETRTNVRRAMDQYAMNQTAMQDDIDTLKTKMDQLMEMLTARHVRKEKRPATAAAAAASVAAAVAAANNAANNVANNAANNAANNTANNAANNTANNASNNAA